MYANVRLKATSRDAECAYDGTIVSPCCTPRLPVFSIRVILISMKPLTLGQLAVAVGASRRWVLNALARLEIPRGGYDESVARRLSLARQLAEAMRMPLTGAYAAAGVILAETDPHGTWRVGSVDGAVRIEVDLPRFFSAYLPRLALARTHYQEKRRGRPFARGRTAVERAQAWGWDTTLLDSALRLPLDQRMKRAADWAAYASEMRKRASGR